MLPRCCQMVRDPAVFKDMWITCPGGGEQVIHNRRKITTTILKLECMVCNWPAPTIEKRRVHNTSTDGESHPQLPDGLEQLGHDSNLLAMKMRQNESVHITNIIHTQCNQFECNWRHLESQTKSFYPVIAGSGLGWEMPRLWVVAT